MMVNNGVEKERQKHLIRADCLLQGRRIAISYFCPFRARTNCLPDCKYLFIYPVAKKRLYVALAGDIQDMYTYTMNPMQHPMQIVATPCVSRLNLKSISISTLRIY